MRRAAIWAACGAGAIGLGLAGPAVAQAPQSPGPFLTEAPNLLRLTKVKGLGVIGLDHTGVGPIQDLVMDRDGHVQAIVIGVGGFLGIGEKSVAVPFADVLWNTGNVTREGPSGSTPPGMAGQQKDAPPANPERMPGATVGNEVLSSTSEGRGGQTNPESGPTATAKALEESATTLLVPADGSLERAEIRLSRSQLQAAPAFRFR